MYEIYGGKIYDLLNNHEVLKILEDKMIVEDAESDDEYVNG